MTAPLIAPGLTIVSGETVALPTCDRGCGCLHTVDGAERWTSETEAVNIAKVHAETTGHVTTVHVEFVLMFLPHVSHVERQAVTS